MAREVVARCDECGTLLPSRGSWVLAFSKLMQGNQTESLWMGYFQPSVRSRESTEIPKPRAHNHGIMQEDMSEYCQASCMALALPKLLALRAMKKKEEASADVG